jgi:hypothetical protein
LLGERAEGASGSSALTGACWEGGANLLALVDAKGDALS